MSQSFEGLGIGQYGFSVTGAPPDTNGAVGLTQYVQWVNTSFAIFNKSSGALVSGPTAGNTLWAGFGGACATKNDGDPIVLYDKLANRWVFSQFTGITAPFLQCIAVSTTSDATGTYNRYAFQYSDFDDYPKMGVWLDAYYETFNMFDANGSFLGSDACAYDRNAMLNGRTATQICFQQSSSVGGLLPADLDGTVAPPQGSPNYMVTYGTNSLNLFKFHVDFATPANSAFSGPTVISVAPFTPLCNGDTCVPQPGTTNQLDSLADRLMYRLAYRNLGTHESLVVNHSVSTSSGGGIRWYEIQNPSGTPILVQQGTFASDSNYRWMGSIAMDKAGDIALGYSVSNGNSVFPSIAFTGRAASDPSGTLQAETSVVSGGGSQTGNLTRWGDYSAMQVDPVDDCTFWYTQEYIKANGTFNWSTRINSFSFPNCGTSSFSLSVTLAGTGSGAVTSSPAGINCPGTCNASFASGTSVNLTASATAGSTFAGWAGACSGTGACTVTMNAAKSVTATFNAVTASFPLSVSLAGTGSGSATSSPAGINCPSTCSANFNGGTAVTLTATAAAGSAFAGWGGACSGTGACTVTVSAAKSVTATFNLVTASFRLSVTLAGTGSGSVTSSPSGINCPSTCNANFTGGTTVTLTAATAGGSTFAGWGGACSGTGACTVTMNSAQSVTATFNPVVSTFPLSVTLSGGGSGSITSTPAGIKCPGTCSASFSSGTMVTLNASAAGGSVFAGWSGACSGTGSCSIAMTVARSVGASFRATTTTTLTDSSAQVSAGSSVTFTAKVSSSASSTTPTGTITFSNGSSALGTAQLTSGIAIFTTSSLSVGNYSVTASYAGDTNSAGSSSAPVALTVVDIAVTTTQSNLTVMRGKSVQTGLTVTSSGPAGFSPTITFACSGLPAQASCSFNPPTLISNGAPISTTLTIQTVAPSARLERLFRRAELFYAFLLPGLFGIVVVSTSGKRPLHQMRPLALVGLLLLSTVWWTACGGGSNTGSVGATTQNNGTPVGSSTVTITATSSGAPPISKQITVTLTVQ